jgi:hypothetical protein
MRKVLLVGIALVLLVVGGVIGLTWFTDGGPEPRAAPSNGGLDGTGFQTADLPRGITVDSVAVSPLLEEHVNRLEDSTYTLTVETTKERAGQSVTTETIYTVGQRELLIEQYAGDTLILVEYYDSQTGEVFQCTTPTQSSCPTSVTQTVGQTELVSDLLRATFVTAKWTPVTVTDQTAYTEVTLASSTLIDEDSFAKTLAADSIDSFNATATVDSRQVISYLHVTSHSPNQSHSYSMSVEGLNQTLVERPSWASNDANQVRQQSGITIDNRTVFYTHASNEPVPQGALLTLYSESGNQYRVVAESTLESGLTSGQTVYATVTDGRMSVALNDTPEQRGEPLEAQTYVLRISDSETGDVLAQLEIPR